MNKTPRKTELPSKRTSFEPSPTLQTNELVTALKKEGIDVVSFGAGAPKLPPSEKVRGALAEVNLGEVYSYGSTKGDAYLRDSIRTWNKALGLNSISNKETQVTAGAKEAVFVSMLTLCDAGDRVGIVKPYWPSYVNMGKALDLEIVYLDEDVFLQGGTQLERFLEDIGRHLKALIFSTPSNPTGSFFELDVLEKIAWISDRCNFWVISDEIYQTLYYPPGKDRSPSILDVSAETSKRCIQINSASKSLSLMGLRCGWIVGPKEFIDAVSTVISNIEGHPDRIAQYLVAIGLNEGLSVQRHRSSLMEERRDTIVSELSKVPWIETSVPEAGMFLWAKVTTGSLSTLELSERLLVEQGVAVVPGDAFGTPGFLRMSFGEELENIKAGVSRMASLRWPR